MNKKESINSLEKVLIGGIEQWLLMKGNDINNPVLLFLHGGPGFPAIPFSHAFPEAMDEYFTTVFWDQRGAGKTFSGITSDVNMTIEQFVLDTHELTQILKHRFGKDKIFLMGHSWGCVPGLLSASTFAEDYHAYIGVGQVVNTLKADTLAYEFAICKAREKTNLEDLDKLARIGYPPYKINDTYVKNGYIIAYGGGLYNESSFAKLGRIAGESKYYTREEFGNVDKGVSFSFSCLFDEISKIDFFSVIKQVNMPVYLCSGIFDYLVPHSLVKQYFDYIECPKKRFVYFDKSGHFPYLEQPEEFSNFLISILNEEPLNMLE